MCRRSSLSVVVLSILCLGWSGEAFAVPRPLEALLTYDLRPYEGHVPAFLQAWKAIQGHGDPQEGLTLLDKERRRSLEKPTNTWADPFTRQSAHWLRHDLLLRLDRDEEAQKERSELHGSRTSFADLMRRSVAEREQDNGRPLEAAKALFDITPGMMGHVRGVRRALLLARESGQLAWGIEQLETLLEKRLSSATRRQLSKLLIELWLETGQHKRAARLGRQLWWEGVAEQDQRWLKQVLVQSGSPLSKAEQVARSICKARRASRELKREVKRWRPKKAFDRAARAWALAVMARHDPKSQVASVKKLERLMPKFVATSFEPIALYGQALVLRKLDRDLQAVAAYRKIADQWPAHALASDALMQAAELLTLRGLPLDADRLRRRVVALGVHGPTERESLWTVGFLAFLQGEYNQSVQHLSRLIARYGADHAGASIPWAVRASYWLARISEKQGKIGDAIRAYSAIALQLPSSWYALLAKQRRAFLLQPSSSVEVERTSSMLALSPPTASRVERSLDSVRVLRQPLLDSIIVLIKLGEEGRARQELEALLASNQLEASGRALLAALWRRAGNPDKAQALIRRMGIPAQIPTTDDVELYRDFYPDKYNSLMDKVSRDNGLPVALLAGLVYVESRYEPHAVSRAGAIGLTQLMPSTARMVSQRVLGKHVSRRALRQPETNLILGASLMRGLLDYFQGHIPLALTGYNAGRGATRKWLRQRGHQQTDVFVETIPRTQTRNYVMRVTAVAEIYCRVHGLADCPDQVPLELPVTMGTFLETSEKAVMASP